MLAQQPHRPVCDPQRLGWSLNCRDHDRHVVDHRRTTRAVQIAQRRYPAGLIPVAPLNHRRTRNPDPATDFRVRHPLGGQQHDPRPLRQPRLHRRGTRQRTQPRLITDTKNKRGSNRHTSLSQNHTVKSLPTRNTRPTGARAIRRQLHVRVNTAGRKGLNLDSFDESVVEYRCCCRRFESVGPTVTNVEHRTTEHHSAAGRAMPSTTPQA